MAEISLPLPRLGETMEEGRIVAWLKQPGDRFKRGEILLEVETDKTVVEVPALQDGVMVEHLAAEADMIPVDAPIARIEVAGTVEAPAAPKPAAAPTPTMAKAAPSFGARPSNNGLRASPRARRLARDRGIDLATLAGTGRNGRISGDDVIAAETAKDAAPQVAIQVATIAGTIQVREWPAAGQRRGDAFLIHGCSPMLIPTRWSRAASPRVACGSLPSTCPAMAAAMRRPRASTSWWIRRQWPCAPSLSGRCAWLAIPSAP